MKPKIYQTLVAMEVEALGSKQNSSIDAYDVWLVLMNTANMFMHALGFFLLGSLKRRENDVQRIYLINLSITEFLKNLLILLTVIPDLINLPRHAKIDVDLVHIYLGIFYDYAVMCSFYLTMFSITLDRYFFISWNDAYKIHWKYKQARFLMLSIWALGFSLSIIICLVYRFHENGVIKYFIYIRETESIVIAYCRPLIDIPFVLLAVAVYYKIFGKYYKSQQRISSSAQGGKRKQGSSIKLFIRSRFLITALLIASFLLFTFIPDMIFTYYAFTHKDISYHLEAVCYILFSISDLSDGVIYIFILNKVRKKLLIQLRKFCIICFSSTVDERNYDIESSNTLSVTGKTTPYNQSSTLL